MIAEDGFIYDLGIQLVHPSEDVSRISRELGVEPEYHQQCGAPRITPAGTRRPGVYPQTRWSYWIYIKGDKRFFDETQRLLERLEAASDYLYGFIESAGTVKVVVHLAGRRTISDFLTVAHLRRMARIGVGLGIEVFPNMPE